MKEQRLLSNTYLCLYLCIWVLCYPTTLWCLYKAVPHHVMVATCLSTANWEKAHILYNGCCVYTRMHIQWVGACAVYILVWSIGLCMYSGHTYSTLCSVTYIQYKFIYYAIVYVHCVIVGVRYATTHMHCVIVGRYFFKKVHRYCVCTYVRMYNYIYLSFMLMYAFMCWCYTGPTWS